MFEIFTEETFTLRGLEEEGYYTFLLPRPRSPSSQILCMPLVASVTCLPCDMHSGLFPAHNQSVNQDHAHCSEPFYHHIGPHWKCIRGGGKGESMPPSKLSKCKFSAKNWESWMMKIPYSPFFLPNWLLSTPLTFFTWNKSNSLSFQLSYKRISHYSESALIIDNLWFY